MAEAKKNLNDIELTEKLNVLVQKERDLTNKLVRFQTQRDQLSKQLNEAKKEARDLHGTDDLNELRNRYQKKITENNERVRAYEAGLTAMEEGLQSIDKELKALD